MTIRHTYAYTLFIRVTWRRNGVGFKPFDRFVGLFKCNTHNISSLYVIIHIVPHVHVIGIGMHIFSDPWDDHHIDTVERIIFMG